MIKYIKKLFLTLKKIPPNELWLWDNKKALASVKRGLKPPNPKSPRKVLDLSSLPNYNNFILGETLIIQLHHLIMNNLGDSDEADVLRENIFNTLNDVTSEQKIILENLIGDLYQLSNQEELLPPLVNILRKDIYELLDKKDWPGLLHKLRYKSNISSSERAYLRGHAYYGLNLKIASAEFYSYIGIPRSEDIVDPRVMEANESFRKMMAMYKSKTKEERIQDGVRWGLLDNQGNPILPAESLSQHIDDCSCEECYYEKIGEEIENYPIVNPKRISPK